MLPQINGNDKSGQKGLNRVARRKFWESEQESTQYYTYSSCKLLVGFTRSPVIQDKAQIAHYQPD